MKSEKIKFIKRGLIFSLGFLPIIIPLAFYTYVAEISNENYDLDEVIERQIESEEIILFGPAYSNPNRAYKLSYINKTSPDVIAMGSSRVMQFRDELFTASFINAGGLSRRMGEFKHLLYNIPEEKRPKLAIIGLDQYYFNEFWDDGTNDRTDFSSPGDEFNMRWIRDRVYWVFRDFFKEKKYSLGDFANADPNRVGINAIINNRGFRNDGSYYYGRDIEEGGVENEDHNDYQFQNTLDRIGTANRRFQHAQDISVRAKDELDKFLSLCKENNIHVIGIFPPFAPPVWDELVRQKENYAYLFKLETELKPYFDGYGYELYDYSDMQSFGAKDCEVVDGFHGSDVAYLRMLINMVEKSDELKKYTDVGRLSQILENVSNCFNLFEEEYIKKYDN